MHEGALNAAFVRGSGPRGHSRPRRAGAFSLLAGFLLGSLVRRDAVMAAGKITAAICGIGLAAVSASMAVTAARPALGMGLKEINYAREPQTSILGRHRSLPLTPQQAKEALEARGFRDVAAPQRRGRVAVLAATAPRGERVTLVIDLASGEIAGVRLQAAPAAKSTEKR